MPVAAIALIAVTGCTGVTQRASAQPDAPQARVSDATPVQTPAPVPSATASSAPSPLASEPEASATPLEFPDGLEPATVRIPAIGVDADVIELGQQGDGTLETPEDYAETGWWAGGPRPGQLGAAIIAGHVDSTSGPAVFYELRNLRKGDEIVVEGADGETVTFTVDRLEQHAKDEFPTEAVYGYTREPSLRLVTCGGDFDRSLRSYTDNIVVFAELTSS